MQVKTTAGSVMNLFPLNLVDVNLNGYFVGADGEVYSTKQGKGATRMLGSRSLNGTETYLTMQRRTFGKRDIVRRAKSHSQFTAHTNQPLVAPSQVAVEPQLASWPMPNPTARSHAATTAAGVAAKGYLLATLDGDTLVFGTKPVIHLTDTSVKSEAERIAITKPGQKIVMLKIMGSVQAKAVAWE